MRYAILSTNILIEDGMWSRLTITLTDALAWVKENSFDNYCGHETVRLLGIEPSKRSRKQCEGYDQALCLTANERLEFGREYTLEEIQGIGVTFTLITREKTEKSYKVSKFWTGSPMVQPLGETGEWWAKQWGVTQKEAYGKLHRGDFYATGYCDYGYHMHFITGDNERSQSGGEILK